MSEPNETRERACDWLILGPVVGFTDQFTTRILAQAYEDDRGQLELRIAKAAKGARFHGDRGGFGPVAVDGALQRVVTSEPGAFGTEVFTVSGLEPGTRYFYEIVPKHAASEVAGCFASRQPFSFATLPAHPSAFRFSFHSCNGLHKPPRGQRPTDMWARLVEETLSLPSLRFALLGGDQIYADVIREEWLREWEPEFDPETELGEHATRCAEFLARLPERYERIYRTFWRRPEIRTFMGHLPCLMTWDDHEIYDGWGSHGDESLPAQQAFFNAAAATFDAFQFSLAPRATISAKAAEHREGHRGFSFMVGDVAFLVLDLRSQRNIHSREPSAVLGETQWEWLCAELDELATRKLSQVVVVSSIPMVHMGANVENLMPNAAEMHDDVLDHWSSRPNRNDQARLLGNLFRLRKQTGANMLLLSGDVHVGTIGHVVCSDPRFLLEGESEARIHQGVSSAIAYEAPTGISGNFVRWLCQREHPIRGHFKGAVEEVVTARNFSFVTVQGNGAIRFTLFREDSKVPDQYYFGS